MLEDLGNLGDFVGGIAVVATMIYLAIQIRQNTRTMQTTSFQDLSDHHSNILLAMMTDESMRQVLLLGRKQAWSDMDDETRMQFGSMVMQQMRSHFNAWTLFEAGMITEEQRATFDVSLSRILASKAFDEWWDHQGSAFPPAFREFVAARRRDPRVTWWADEKHRDAE